ncbi:sce7726 family protein [Paenibacillus sp. FSL H8-0261]|uniref:sce7726 family protein n=1 Tax=Paenibacillus sp. FSL H8-0261 TaxID=2921381 RepID=UPI00324C3BD8
MDRLNDPEIRGVLYKKIALQEEFISDPSTILVDELDVCTGSARIDVAVVNGKLHGYEIKSERDNLDRLPSQIEYYNRVFDTLTLVTTKSHISKAREIIPKWWGIDCVNNIGQDIRIKTIRKPKDNHKVQLLDLTQLLWKDELLELLQSQGINKGVKSKTRYQLGVIVSDKVDREIVSTFVREKLKARTVWRAHQLQLLCDDLQLS